MDEKRKTAWKEAIKKKRSVSISESQRNEITRKENDALLREGMFGVKNKDALEEAVLFLHYFFHGLNVDPLPWLGESIAHHWFELRDWDRKWGKDYKERADRLLREYIAADDFDHWAALNLIAERLHRARVPFPDALADWAADVHARLQAGTLKPPAKEQGHKGDPPYANEDRNGLYFAANDWLEHFGMKNATDRIGVIAEWIGDDESVVRKGLTKWRKGNWRRAPWPTFPSD